MLYLFLCSIYANRKRDKSSYCFPYRTRIRARTIIKLTLSASPSSFFSRKVYNIKFEKQLRILSKLIVIELGPTVLESSTRISKFYNRTEFEQELHKTRIENWLLIGLELEFPWMETYIYNPYNMLN